MTFIENLEPLLKAAENFAKAAKLHRDNQYRASTKDSYEEADCDLKQAAVKYAEWGK
jgi:hypothetical protein